MVDYPFSQGGASLALGFYILPFQGNTPVPLIRPYTEGVI